MPLSACILLKAISLATHDTIATSLGLDEFPWCRKIDRSVLGGPTVVRAVRPIGRCIDVRLSINSPAG